MSKLIRRLIGLLTLVWLTVVTTAMPASAQQVIDAGKERQGGLAFVAFAFMCFLTVAALFFMDRIRRRREEEERESR
jgi:hypothetical protein